MSITNIDANGRVLIPSCIRLQLNLKEGDNLAIDELGDGTIILKKIDCKIRFQSRVIDKEKNQNTPIYPIEMVTR
jgi:AbrB family looped-hinge helix DNA binding protein